MRVTRITQSTKKGAPPESIGVRDFVSSLPASTSPQQFLKIIRSHWGIENKNHWKRDTQWDEDQPLHNNTSTARVLAILRGALLALMTEPCPKLFAIYRRHPMRAFSVLSASPLAK